MDDKILGFVLQSIRYGDTSLIVRFYTLNNGLQSYMVKGVRGKDSKNRIAFFQPMTFLRFVQSGKPHGNALAYLKDPEIAYSYQSIPLVMNKSAILLYLSELLSHTLTQQERNDDLYQYIFQSVVWLDLVESGYANFPLYFTLGLTKFLGFYPQANVGSNTYFDMMEGQFVATQPPHPYYLEKEDCARLSKLLDCHIDDLSSVSMTGAQRNMLLDGILTFMRLHAPVLKGLQSHEILRDILRG